MIKDSFILYKSFYAPVRNLSDKQLGRLFRALFNYQIEGSTQVDADLEMAFGFFRNQMDLDEAKYQDKVRVNKENGSKGGRPGKEKNPKKRTVFEKPKKANGFFKNPNDNDNDNDNDNVNDKDNNPPNPLTGTGAGDNPKLENIFPGYESFSFDFITISGFRDVLRDWLEYKRKRKEKYKVQKSLELCYNNLVKLSNGNPETARLIANQSMANNWAGLFELKNNTSTGKASGSQTKKDDILKSLKGG
jgi:hypothetical protein